MPDLHIKHGGAWDAIEAAHVKVADAWEAVSKVYVKVAGAWEEVWTALRVQLEAGIYFTESLQPTNAVYQYRLTSAGLEQADQGAGYATQGTWLVEGAAADYDVRYSFSGDTGAVTLGSNATWENLGTSRAWAIQDTGPAGGVLEITGTIEIRDAVTLEVLESKTLTLQAQETA